jgi:hypothetical protein
MGSGVTLSRSVFVRNFASARLPEGPGYGGAISAGGGTIEKCTLLANSGGVAIGVGGIAATGAVSIRAVILAGTASGAACSGAAASWSCSNLFGNAQGNGICGTDSGGNFSADPQLCAADPVSSLNVLIQSDSPCAPGNHPDGAACGLIGAGPVGCGAVAVQQRAWSDVKSLYR